MTKELANQLRKFADLGIGRKDVRQKFIERSENERLTRDEGELTHVGVFIMAIDVRANLVYLGHHKKAGRWIPHGGHVDEGELVEQTLEREIWEEWGRRLKASEIGGPVLLTITEIKNPNQWEVCRRHYDVWYFVQLDSDNFSIDPGILRDEFYEARWFNLAEAAKIVGDNPPVLEALSLLSSNIF